MSFELISDVAKLVAFTAAPAFLFISAYCALITDNERMFQFFGLLALYALIAAA